MKTYIVLSLTIAFVLLAGGSFTPAYSQPPASPDAPTFYRWTPGTYVNGWPRFTVTYPKEWIERPIPFGVLFQALSPDRREGVTTGAIFSPLPLDKYIEFLVPYFSRQASDVTVVSNKASRLRDGTPAWEVEMKMVMNGVPLSWMAVATTTGGILVSVNVSRRKDPLGEDLRRIAYSVQFEPEKDRSIPVPADVRAFLDSYCDANVSHDIAEVVGHFSDAYLNTGVNKGKLEQLLKTGGGRIMSCKAVVTDFVPQGNKAHLTGYLSLNLGTLPIAETSIIKENGQWKWFGNQRDVVP